MQENTDQKYSEYEQFLRSIQNLFKKTMVDLFCESKYAVHYSLREKCPNAEFFLARIFLYLDWIRRFTP